MFGDAIHHGAGRPDRHQKPEKHAKYVTVRRDQCTFGDDTRNFTDFHAGRVLLGPFGQQGARGHFISGVQGELDGREVVAVMAEAERQIHNQHVPGEGQKDTDMQTDPINQRGRHGQRQHHESPAELAVMRVSGVEPVFDAC